MTIARPIPTPIHLLRANGAWQSRMDGDPRGANAVDLQATASADNLVAAGESSLAAGIDNQSNSIGSAAIGEGNTAGINFPPFVGRAEVAFGRNNGAFLDQWSFGSENTGGGGAIFGVGNSSGAAGAPPFFVFGKDSTAANTLSCAFGTANRIKGEHDVSFGALADDRGAHSIRPVEFFRFGSDGDVMYQHRVHYVNTTDGMTKRLSYNNSGATTMTLWPGTHFLRVTGVARQTNGTDWAGWLVALVVRSGDVILDEQELRHEHSAGGASWTFVVSTVGMRGATNIHGTGQAGKTIRWHTGVDILSVAG